GVEEHHVEAGINQTAAAGGPWRGGGGDRGGAHQRASGLYLMRWGWSASAPSSFLRKASYSLKLPSNHRTWLSPSKASMWVAMRSRNHRSWEITTAQPAYASR